MIVRLGASLEVEKMSVGTCEMNENVLAIGMEYKCTSKVERFLLCMLHDCERNGCRKE